MLFTTLYRQFVVGGRIPFTVVTTNMRLIAFKRVRPKLRFGGRQAKKSRWNYFESLQDSKATRQEIENFTSLSEGKSWLN